MSNGEVLPRSPHFAVHKFPFLISDVVRLQMPREARLLHVGVQAGPLARGDLQLWAQVDKRQPMVERVLLIYGTAHDMPAQPGQFIGTVIMNGGALVWHIYDAGEVH